MSFLRGHVDGQIEQGGCYTDFTLRAGERGVVGFTGHKDHVAILVLFECDHGDVLIFIDAHRGNCKEIG